MDPSTSPITPAPEGIRIRVRVQPRASKDEIAGEHDGAIRIRLKAPPVDGAANEALVRFLAERLGVARSSVTLEHGQAGRLKVVRVRGVTPAAAAGRLR